MAWSGSGCEGEEVEIEVQEIRLKCPVIAPDQAAGTVNCSGTINLRR